MQQLAAGKGSDGVTGRAVQVATEADESLQCV
jgi:hypothetical protein